MLELSALKIKQGFGSQSAEMLTDREDWGERGSTKKREYSKERYLSISHKKEGYRAGHRNVKRSE